jgi:hypothetical protein
VGILRWHIVDHPNARDLDAVLDANGQLVRAQPSSHHLSNSSLELGEGLLAFLLCTSTIQVLLLLVGPGLQALRGRLKST